MKLITAALALSFCTSAFAAGLPVLELNGSAKLGADAQALKIRIASEGRMSGETVRFGNEVYKISTNEIDASSGVRSIIADAPPVRDPQTGHILSQPALLIWIYKAGQVMDPAIVRSSLQGFQAQNLDQLDCPAGSNAMVISSVMDTSGQGGKVVGNCITLK